MENYIKGKGILVGRFTEADLNSGKDKIEVEKAKQRTGLKYTNTEIDFKKKTITIYVCKVEDFKL